MSLVLTGTQISEQALRVIQAFPITESAAEPEQLRVAMQWLDLIMAEVAGTTILFSMIPATLPVPLTNGTDTYDLNATLGASLPLDKIQFPVQAWIEDQRANRYPVEIVTRETFEEQKTLVGAPITGRPIIIYIDRLPVTPIMRTFPTILLTDPNTYTLKIDVQTYAPNVAPGGVTGTQPQGSVLTNFRQAWQRWLILELSHDLGSGPIFKIGQGSLDNIDKKKKLARANLDAFENRQHDTEPPIGEPWGL